MLWEVGICHGIEHLPRSIIYSEVPMLYDIQPTGVNVISCRILQGTSETAGYLLISSMACRLFPHNVTLVMSLIEAAFYIGVALGPPVGNVLYNVMGFKLPFLVLGSSAILFSCIFGMAAPDIKSEDSSHKFGCHEMCMLFSQVGSFAKHKLTSVVCWFFK